MVDLSFQVRDIGSSAVDAVRVSALLGKFAPEVVLDYTYTSFSEIDSEAHLFDSLPSNVFGIRRAVARTKIEKERELHPAHLTANLRIEVDAGSVSFDDASNMFSWAGFYPLVSNGKCPSFVRAFDRILGAPFFMSKVCNTDQNSGPSYFPRSSQAVIPLGYRTQKRTDEIADLFGCATDIFDALKKARNLIQTDRFDTSLGCLSMFSYDEYLKHGVAYDYVLLISYLYSKLGYVQTFIEAISRFHEAIESSRVLSLRAGNFYFGAYQKSEDLDHYDLAEYWYGRSFALFHADEDHNASFSKHYKDLGRSKANELLMFARGYQ